MTEQETISCLKADKEYLIDMNVCDGEEMDVAIKALEEIQQYRAIGTVEQLEWCKDASHWKSLYEEKLAKYEAIGTPEECRAAVEKQKEIRNKAIDDFIERLNAKCDGMIEEPWNSNVAPISWAEAYADFKDDIEEIAEQLKGGGVNE